MGDAKIVAVGDESIGKTCLLMRYQNKAFPSEYVPTVCETYQIPLKLHDHTVQLSLWDNSVSEAASKLAQLSFPKTDIFLLCFSVVFPESFVNAREKWHPLILRSPFSPHNPAFLLVGTKSDLRKDEQQLTKLAEHGKKPVSIEEAEEFAHQLGTVYLECSALTGDNVDQVFLTAVDQWIASGAKDHQAQKKSHCFLM